MRSSRSVFVIINNMMRRKRLPLVSSLRRSPKWLPIWWGRNEKGETESGRYEQINAMLLNEFLKEHARVEEQGRKIEKQEATITQLKKDVEALVARLREHDSKIQRGTDRIETATPESQMALNDQQNCPLAASQDLPQR